MDLNADVAVVGCVSALLSADKRDHRLSWAAAGAAHRRRIARRSGRAERARARRGAFDVMVAHAIANGRYVALAMAKALR